MEEIELNGKKYVEKIEQAEKNKEGLTYCIIRTYSAGVWAGWIDIEDKNLCQKVYDARRLWRWWSEFTLSALAVDGMKKGKEKENKYAMPVPLVVLKQITEVIPCSQKSAKQIQDKENYSE